MSIAVHLNVPDFARQLRLVESELRTKIVRQAMAAGAGVCKKAVVQDAPQARAPHVAARGVVVQPGNLRRSAYVFRMRGQAGTTAYRISIRQGRSVKTTKRGGKMDAYYWGWVHQGHLVRGPGGKIRGGTRRAALERNRLKSGGARMVPPNPFLTRAWQKSQQAAIDVAYARLERGVVRLNAIR